MSIQGLFLTEDNSPRLNVSHNTITGVTQNLLNLDVYHLNEGIYGNKPVIFWVHGGAWMLGDKVSSLDSKAKFFNSLGYIFVTVNYRLSPALSTSTQISSWVTTRVRHPNHINDVVTALKWTYNNIVNFGGNKNRIVVAGHSAGAHLVSLLCTNITYINSAYNTTAEDNALRAAIKGCVSLDTDGYNVSDIILNVDDEVGGSSSRTRAVYANAFAIPPIPIAGTTYTIDYPKTTAGRDDCLAFYNQASPANNVSTAICPFLVVTRGTESRITRARDFFNSLPTTIRTNSKFVAYLNNITTTGEIYSHEDINFYVGDVNDPPIPINPNSDALNLGASRIKLTDEVRNFVARVI